MALGHLVKKIQAAENSDKAVELYSTEVGTWNLSDTWIRAVFKHRKSIPVLDELFDVHGKGVSVLTQMGISEEVQGSMWSKWPALPEDVRASWIQSFSDVDENDPRDVFEFASKLVKLLS